MPTKAAYEARRLLDRTGLDSGKCLGPDASGAIGVVTTTGGRNWYFHVASAGRCDLQDVAQLLASGPHLLRALLDENKRLRAEIRRRGGP